MIRYSPDLVAALATIQRSNIQLPPLFVLECAPRSTEAMLIQASAVPPYHGVWEMTPVTNPKQYIRKCAFLEYTDDAWLAAKTHSILIRNRDTGRYIQTSVFFGQCAFELPNGDHIPVLCFDRIGSVLPTLYSGDDDFTFTLRGSTPPSPFTSIERVARDILLTDSS